MATGPKIDRSISTSRQASSPLPRIKLPAGFKGESVTVVASDTLKKIASQHHVTEQELIDLNPGLKNRGGKRDGYLIFPGDKLRLPEKKKTAIYAPKSAQRKPPDPAKAKNAGVAKPPPQATPAIKTTDPATSSPTAAATDAAPPAAEAPAPPAIGASATSTDVPAPSPVPTAAATDARVTAATTEPVSAGAAAPANTTAPPAPPTAPTTQTQSNDVPTVAGTPPEIAAAQSENQPKAIIDAVQLGLDIHQRPNKSARPFVDKWRALPRDVQDKANSFLGKKAFHLFL